MKSLKTKFIVLLACSSLMLPGAVSAATTTKEIPTFSNTIAQTNVNGINVPGIYIVTKDSRVAYIPGVGIVVVNKDVPLPPGSSYVTKTD